MYKNIAARVAERVRHLDADGPHGARLLRVIEREALNLLREGAAEADVVEAVAACSHIRSASLTPRLARELGFAGGVDVPYGVGEPVCTSNEYAIYSYDRDSNVVVYESMQ